MARTPNRRDIARSLLAAEDFPPLPSQISQHATPNNSSDITSAPKRGHESVTSIMSLPDEILLEILEHLHPGRFSTCLRLSRVNRRFYFLVRNELYLRYDSCSKQGYQFMRTIMISPEIGDLVRYVHFSCPGQDIRHLLGRKHPPTTRKYYQPTPSDCRIIKNVLKQLDIPRWKDWATQCNHAIYDTKQEPIYATILMHVRNIAKLIIDQDDFADKNPRWIELIRGSVNGESFKNVNHFTHLHYVRVRVRHLGMPKLAPLFKLPALRYLKIIDVVHVRRGLDKEINGLRRALPAARTCMLQGLTLDKCVLGSDMIEVLLQCVHSLRSFKHHPPRYLPRYENPPMLNYSALSTSLSRFENTLEHFSLGAELTSDERRLDSVFESMSRLTKITHFEAPVEALIEILHRAEEHIVIQRLPPLTKTIIIYFISTRLSSVIAMKHMRAYIKTAQEQGLLPSARFISLHDSRRFNRRYYGAVSDDEMESDITDEESGENDGHESSTSSDSNIHFSDDLGTWGEDSNEDGDESSTSSDIGSE